MWTKAERIYPALISENPQPFRFSFAPIAPFAVIRSCRRLANHRTPKYDVSLERHENHAQSSSVSLVFFRFRLGRNGPSQRVVGESPGAKVRDCNEGYVAHRGSRIRTFV